MHFKLSIAVLTFTLIIAGVSASSGIDDKEREELVGVFGTLLAPTIFSSAKSESVSASIYGRTISGEGEVPDFRGNIRSTIDSLQIFVVGNFGNFGAGIGFGQGNEFEFSQPFIISADYRMSLFKDVPYLNFIVDAQYSMIYLPDGEKIKVSAPGFGVASLSGIVGSSLLLFEPYGGVTYNYVYLNSEDEKIRIGKLVPKVGLKLKILPFINIGSEVSFIRNVELRSSWVWNIGASARF